MSDRVYERLARGLLAAHPHVVAESVELVNILSACTPRELAAGERLCEEGDPGIELYFLLRGAIRVLKSNPSGGHTLLGVVEAPALLGQMAILDRTRRSATCVAVDTALVVVMDQPSFSHTIRSTGPDGHTLRRLLLSSLTRQLVHSNARLRSLTTDRNGTFVPPDPAAAEVQMQRARHARGTDGGPVAGRAHGGGADGRDEKCERMTLLSHGACLGSGCHLRLDSSGVIA